MENLEIMHIVRGRGSCYLRHYDAMSTKIYVWLTPKLLLKLIQIYLVLDFFPSVRIYVISQEDARIPKNAMVRFRKIMSFSELKMDQLKGF